MLPIFTNYASHFESFTETIELLDIMLGMLVASPVPFEPANGGASQ